MAQVIKFVNTIRYVIAFCLIVISVSNSLATTYSSSAVIQQTGAVVAGATDQTILRIMVDGGGGGAGFRVCQMQFDMNNSVTPDNARLFYTGTSTSFATTTQLGATVVNPTGTITYTFSQVCGSSPLYFWLAYDIPVSAANCSTFDAFFTTNGLTYTGAGGSCPGGSSTTPSTPNPAGYRSIESVGCWTYSSCTSASTNCSYEYITDVVTTSPFSNTTGCTYYADYRSLGPIITTTENSSFILSVTLNKTYSADKLYVFGDWDNDGTLVAGELSGSKTDFVTNASPVTADITVTIPAGALAGTTMLRVKFGDNSNMDNTPCQASYTFGEVEDYEIEICPNPTTITPASSTICSGGTETFTATTDYSTIQWQDSPDGSSWSDITGETAGTYTTPALAVNTYYRATYVDACTSSETNAVLVTLVSGPSISSDPSDVSVCAGSSEVLSVAASPGSATYQWQYNSGTWNDVADGTPANFTYTNATTSDLNIATTSAATPGVYVYRCVVTACASSVYSGSATVTVKGLPNASSVSASPNSGTINCATGAGLSTTLTLAGGYTGTIQWQVSSDNSTWTDIVGAIASTYVTTVSTTTYFRTTQTLSGCISTNTSTSVIITNTSANNFTGASGGNWNTAGNWSGGIPTTCHNVTIPAGKTIVADLNTANANCHDLTIVSGGQLTVNRQNGRWLSIYGNLMNNSNGNGNALGGIQQNTASTTNGQGNASGIQLMGSNSTWGGANNTLYPLLTLRVGDGSNVYVTSDATLDLLDATKTATAGSISIGSTTFKIVHSFYNSGSFVHVNTGYLWLQITADMLIQQSTLEPEYGTVFFDLAGNWGVTGSWNTIGSLGGFYNLEMKSTRIDYGIPFGFQGSIENSTNHRTRGYFKIIAGDGNIKFDNATPYTLQCEGDFINEDNDGTQFVAGLSTVLMDGPGPIYDPFTKTVSNSTSIQRIVGPAITTFNNLTINNTGTDVTLDISANIANAGILTLTDGNLFTSSSNLLVVMAGGSSTSGSPASFVDGPIKKIGNTAFTFPTGDGTVWARLGITNPAGVTTEYTAEYFNHNPNDDGYTVTSVIGPELTTGPGNVSQIEYWTLDQAVTTDDVQVKLFWENDINSGIDLCDLTDLRVAHWNGSAWEINVDGANINGACAQSPDNGDVETNAVQPSYSPFTFASKITTNNPLVLPIVLLYFNASYAAERNEVDLTWVTESEINNDYFTVERSDNGVDFHEIIQVKGAGNSNQTLYYYSIDPDPGYGVKYYRLRQTDYDGQYTYSEISAVHILKPLQFSIRPNPATDHLEIAFGSTVKGATAVLTPDYDAEIRVMDLTGSVVYRKKFDGTFYKFNIDISAFDQGLYLVTLTANGENYTAKFVKE